MSSRTAINVAAALTAGALALAAASPALADSAQDGLWYYDLYDFDAIHASGIDGSGVTIAVIDTPVYADLPTLKNANVTTNQLDCDVFDDGTVPPAESADPVVAFHGTNVTAVIAGTGEGFDGQIGVPGIAPGAKVLTYAVSFGESTTADEATCVVPGETLPLDTTTLAIRQATDAGADIISLSVGTRESDAMINALTYAYQHGAIVVSALPNQQSAEESVELGPANLNGVVSVAMVGKGGEVPLNYEGNPLTSYNVDVAAPGVNMLTQGSADGEPWTQQTLSKGSSLATPFVSAMLALGMQKYPNATPNQLLQSLIHNTGLETHEPTLDPEFKFGYGIVDPITFLGADPSSYPDTNPFLEDEQRNTATDPWGPTIAQVLGTASPTASPTATATPEPTPTATAPAAESGGGVSPLVIAALVLGLIVLIAIVVIVVVAASRRSKEGGHGQV